MLAQAIHLRVLQNILFKDLNKRLSVQIPVNCGRVENREDLDIKDLGLIGTRFPDGRLPPIRGAKVIPCRWRDVCRLSTWALRSTIGHEAASNQKRPKLTL
jgi:hypothetical protein